MTSQLAPPTLAWTIILPVKNTSVAKTRLRPFDQTARATLALAFALDAAVAAKSCPVVRRVIAVTNDAAARSALLANGVEVIADLPDAGLNPALEHGFTIAREQDSRCAVAAMPADLPSLRAADLALAFAVAGTSRYWFVADFERIGTTLLGAAPGQQLDAAFGVQSRAQHLLLGATELSSTGLDRLRRDVDTEGDLREAVRLGVGAHTLGALARIDPACSTSQ